MFLTCLGFFGFKLEFKHLNLFNSEQMYVVCFPSFPFLKSYQTPTPPTLLHIHKHHPHQLLKFCVFILALHPVFSIPHLLVCSITATHLQLICKYPCQISMVEFLNPIGSTTYRRRPNFINKNKYMRNTHDFIV